MTINVEFDDRLWIPIPVVLPGGPASVGDWADNEAAVQADLQGLGPGTTQALSGRLAGIHADLDQLGADLVMAFVLDAGAEPEFLLISLLQTHVESALDDFVDSYDPLLVAPPSTAPITANRLGAGHRILRFVEVEDVRPVVMVSIRYLFECAEGTVLAEMATDNLAYGMSIIPFLDSLCDGISLEAIAVGPTKVAVA